MKAGKLSFALVAVVTAAACTAEQDDPPDPAEAEAAARTTGTAVVAGGGAVARLQTTIAAAFDDGGGGAVASAAGDVRMRIEQAIAALVQATECVSIRWGIATATVTFDDCRVPGTNERLDGALTVRPRPLVPAVELTFGALTFGDHQLDGSVYAYVQGPLASLRFGVDADLALVGDDTTLAVSALTVEASLEGVSLSGTGQVASPEREALATADVLHWTLGQCLPSSGTVDFESGNLRGVITFLTTTPATGEVEVHVPPLPATMVAMFPPCGAS